MRRALRGKVSGWTYHKSEGDGGGSEYLEMQRQKSGRRASIWLFLKPLFCFGFHTLNTMCGTAQFDHPSQLILRQRRSKSKKGPWVQWADFEEGRIRMNPMRVR